MNNLLINKSIGIGWSGKGLSATIPINGIMPVTVNALNTDLYVKQIVAELYYNGNRVNFNTATNVDKVTVLIVNNTYSQMTPFDIAPTMVELAILGNGDNFAGFMLPTNSQLQITFQHFQQTWTSGTLEARLFFNGFAGNKDELASYFSLNDSFDYQGRM